MSAENQSTPHALADQERISLCEILDRVLTKGVVVVGEVVISVADINLNATCHRCHQLILRVTAISTANINGCCHHHWY